MTDAADKLRERAATGFYGGPRKPADREQGDRLHLMAAALREGADEVDIQLERADAVMSDYEEGRAYAADTLRALADELEGKG